MAKFSVREATVEDLTKPSPVVSAVDGELLEVKQLPSGFKTYQTKSVFIRGLKFGEVKILNKASDDKSLKYLVSVYSKVITGIDILELLPVDFKALLFLIAKLTDQDFNLEVTTSCPSCSIVFPTTVDIHDVDYEELTAASELFGDTEFSPLRLVDYIFLEQVSDDYDKEISVLALSADRSIANSSDFEKFKTSYQKIFDIPNSKVTSLQEKINSLTPDLNPIKLKCLGCDHEFSSMIKLDFSQVYL